MWIFLLKTIEECQWPHLIVAWYDVYWELAWEPLWSSVRLVNCVLVDGSDEVESVLGVDVSAHQKVWSLCHDNNLVFAIFIASSAVKTARPRTALLLRIEIKSEHRFLWLGSDLTTLTVSRRAERGRSLLLFWSKWSECEWPGSASGPEKQWNPRKR